MQDELSVNGSARHQLTDPVSLTFHVDEPIPEETASVLQSPAAERNGALVERPSSVGVDVDPASDWTVEAGPFAHRARTAGRELWLAFSAYRARRAVGEVATEKCHYFLVFGRAVFCCKWECCRPP